MSGLEQRTKGLSEALSDASAVNAVTARSSDTEDTVGPHLISSSDWSAIEGDLLDDRRVYVPTFPLDLLPPPWRDWVSDAARSADAPVDYVVQRRRGQSESPRRNGCWSSQGSPRLGSCIPRGTADRGGD